MPQAPHTTGLQEARLTALLARIAQHEGVVLAHTDDSTAALRKIGRKLALGTVHAERPDNLVADLLAHYFTLATTP